MRGLIFALLIGFISLSTLANTCFSVFETKAEIRSEIFKKDYHFRQESPFDVIEIYHPNFVWAIARVIVIKDYNGNMKTHKVIQSKDVRLNMSIQPSLESYNYNLQFFAPSGTYKIVFLRQIESLQQQIVHEEFIQI